MKRYKLLLVFLLLVLCGAVSSHAQRVCLKTNGLEWLAVTPNLGAEFSLREHWSLELSFSVAPWKVTKELYAKEFRFQPELRYWFSQNQVGFYAGLTAYYASFDLGLKNKAYYGDALAAGVTCGHSWILSRRWNLEVAAGVGLASVRYNRYMSGTPHGNPKVERLLPVPSKLSVSFVYILR